MSVRVSAIVVNFQQRDLLRVCLLSIREALRPLGDDHETVVVDNGSTDGSAEMVREDFPDMRMIELTENTGFAGGIAVGIRNSSGDWILCVNNDATVAPDAVVELLRVADSNGENVGSVAAQMVFADRPKIINSAGIDIDHLGIATDRLWGEPVEASENEPVEVFGTSAGAALYRRAMLEDVPFEESFFAYLEDVDVAWRARMLGWRCMYAPGAVVSHHFSATAGHGSSFKHYWSGRNRVRVLARNATREQLLRYGLAMIAFDLANICYVLIVDRSTSPLRGRLDGFRSWRSDRETGASYRGATELSAFIGFRAASRRRRTGPRRTTGRELPGGRP